MSKLINMEANTEVELMHGANAFNEELKNIQSAIVREALLHFKSQGVVRNRKDEDDERYFFNISEVHLFFSLCTNPYVKYREEKDSCGVTYIIYREIPPEMKKIGKYRKTREREAQAMVASSC